MRNKLLALKQSDHGSFQEFFGVLLKKYMSPVTGFNYPLFLEDMNIPENVSVKEHCRKLGGGRAVALVEKLIFL